MNREAPDGTGPHSITTQQRDASSGVGAPESGARSSPAAPASGLAPEFVAKVKDALNHLYDFPVLERHPLAQALAATGMPAAETPGQHLRRELLAAIESLNPGRNVPFRSSRARLYHLLVLHHVESMTMSEAAHELGISRRQAHRDLLQGEQSSAAILWARCSAEIQDKPAAAARARTEIEDLETHPEALDLRLLIAHALEAVQPLAQRRQTSFVSETPPTPVVLLADPVMARQVLVSTLSQAVSQSSAAPIELVLSSDGRRMTIDIRFSPESTGAAPVMDAVVVQLARRLAWQIQQQDVSGGKRALTVQVAAPRPSILIIDDNAGFLELIETYLAGYTRQVLTTRSGREALLLLREATPDAIILDIMMPDMDGWEFLQRLRNDPQTSAIPVIVCSVISNPDLAYSLGASAVLSKGISQQDILAAMRHAGVLQF
jgi:CheY-like chemotaxis protein